MSAATATAAAVGEISVSLWFREVQLGRAPQPVIQGHRFTRWRAVDVLEYWRNRATRAETQQEAQARERFLAQSERASKLSLAKRNSHATGNLAGA